MILVGPLSRPPWALGLQRLPRGRHLLEQLEALADEGRKISWLARRHQIAIDDDVLIDDVRTEQLEIALDRLSSGPPRAP